MTSQAVTIYQEIQKNTGMAMQAVNTLAERNQDNSLSLQISRQSIKYAELYNEASRKLMNAKKEGYKANVVSDAMLRAGIRYHTLLNTSPEHIAELMIKGSNTGILEMEKAMKHNERAGQEALGMAKQLIEFEQSNIKRLKDYL